MNKYEFRQRIQEEIETLEREYASIPECDYVERANVLGKINGLLTAKLISYNLER